jgi:hypothetical protein
MKFDFIWALILAVIAVVLGVYLTSLRQLPVPRVDPAREAAELRLEADQLSDSAARLQDAVMPKAAQEVLAQAVELNEQAALISQMKPLPARQLAEEFTARAKMLSDSAYGLRNAILTRNDSLTQGQELRLARVEWTARNLKALAHRLGGWGLNSTERDGLYESCIMTYGEGARVCEQLRSEAPAGH